MHTVVLGMDERILDVGDSFSQLHFAVDVWLCRHVGAKGHAWFMGVDHKDPNTGYVLHFVNLADAMQFKLSWM